MNEYEEARHMVPNKNLNYSKQEYFLPHHAVQKKDSITIKLRNVFDGSYSQVVLSWLSSLPRNWKPFIANRTSEILDLIPQSRRRYVPTKKNPAADIGSRGVSPKDLSDYRLWWESPSFLSSPEAD
ncbi:uncharacterized protein NPIL_433181 [Nephila pilipes]|uniref:Uncharacterized protein n=1 Tax=Nephila pilipes TaxID=299642 RepID=A0A8X6MZS2_NEPPI|nr:uncharacterized protein NPIL_433181 [Nephila pilipes]